MVGPTLRFHQRSDEHETVSASPFSPRILRRHGRWRWNALGAWRLCGSARKDDPPDRGPVLSRQTALGYRQRPVDRQRRDHSGGRRGDAPNGQDPRSPRQPHTQCLGRDLAGRQQRRVHTHQRHAHPRKGQELSGLRQVPHWVDWRLLFPDDQAGSVPRQKRATSTSRSRRARRSC